MTTIYAVNKGTYSDYRVVALFSTRSDALLFMERHPNPGYREWNDIEEYQLDVGVEHLRAGLAYFWVQMRSSGDLINVDHKLYDIDGRDRADAQFHDSASRELKWFNWYGWAMHEEHAIKSANEHRIALLAAV